MGDTMGYLKELITDETPILELYNDANTSDEAKCNVLGISLEERKKRHIKMMYQMNGLWYYYKVEKKTNKFPFYLMDELMGSYLSLQKGISAVSYQVARENKTIGLVSQNFRNNDYDYYFMSQLPINRWVYHDLSNIGILKKMCSNQEKEELFTQHILEVFALDIYMLQNDRNNSNLQFKFDKSANSFDIAPLYDFSDCRSFMEEDKIQLNNFIVLLNDQNIYSILKTYPQFSDYLSFFLEQGMTKSWEEICKNYHFNQDSEAYEQVFKHYKYKEENQKKILKKYVK